ncbi:hypothetical protein [Deinococcus misasensis]|uniref:hypothetical protein n=1 Tax=Deinococcus misasensis TaxID=392413 RepID=UPI0012F9ABAD|nr:hypothetical protein [Deinococcus misasensis]
MKSIHGNTLGFREAVVLGISLNPNLGILPSKGVFVQIKETISETAKNFWGGPEEKSGDCDLNSHTGHFWTISDFCH